VRSRLKNLLVIIISCLVIPQVFAENVKMKFFAVDTTIPTEQVIITQAQAKLRCVFTKSNQSGGLVRRRYPLTRIQVSSDSFKLNIKKSSLTEWLPGFNLKSCAYVLITIGQDSLGKTVMGDIVLLGKLYGVMSQDELDFIQNRSDANIFLQKRLQYLRLGIRVVRGKRIIIEL
jgi:hypothetical protein